MKYCFELCSRPRKNQSIEDKHAHLVEGIKQSAPPWAWIDSPPPPPHPGGGLVAHANLGKHLGKGIRGQAYYQFRRDFRGEASEDDFIELNFDAAKVNYKQLLHDVFPRYVVAFEAYVGQIQPDDLINRDLDALRQLRFDRRRMIHRIYPALFLDGELCRDALRIPQTEIVTRLEGHVERVQTFHNGVLIIASSEVLPLERIEGLTRELRNLLV